MAALTRRPAQLGEERFQSRCTLDREDSGHDLEAVVEPQVSADLEEGFEGTCFGVGRAEDDAGNARIDEGTCAHGARLKRDEYRAALEAPMASASRRGTQREQLGVGRWIGALFTAIVVARELDTGRVHDHAAYGHIAVLWSEVGLLQRLAHPLFVA